MHIQSGMREECGVFGIFDLPDAARYVALGLHALQHRGQEAAGIASFDPGSGRFSLEKCAGLVRANFSSQAMIDRLPGTSAMGHVRYSTAGSKLPDASSRRDAQPFYKEFDKGGFTIAHNGNLINAAALRRALIMRGSLFSTGSDTECVIHLMARSRANSVPQKIIDAMQYVQGAYALLLMTRNKMMGLRDPFGVRPLMLGRLGDAWVMASESCAFDVIGAQFVREVAPGELVIVERGNAAPRALWLSGKAAERFCLFEFVYFSRPDSVIGGMSVYETRKRIGAQLWKEAPVEADVVCPIPDSGTPAALGFAAASGIPFEMGIVKNAYMGRTFIEPTQQIRNIGARLKYGINRSAVAGRRVVIVDDSVVRGTTLEKIRTLLTEAEARAVHVRVASPRIVWPCHYGVDTPDRTRLIASRMGEAEIAQAFGLDSVRYVSLDGLYAACGVAKGRDPAAPAYCDACFSGDYPIREGDARPLPQFADARFV